MATIRLNGEDRELALPQTVAELLRSLALDLRHVAVERNRQLVPKHAFETTSLADGDALEIVTFVGGG